MKLNTSKGEGQFESHKTHSPDEVLASGGATAFGLKSNKNNQTLVQALEIAPVAEPFTPEEWDNIILDLGSNRQ